MPEATRPGAWVCVGQKRGSSNSHPDPRFSLFTGLDRMSSAVPAPQSIPSPTFRMVDRSDPFGRSQQRRPPLELLEAARLVLTEEEQLRLTVKLKRSCQERNAAPRAGKFPCLATTDEVLDLRRGARRDGGRRLLLRHMGSPPSDGSAAHASMSPRSRRLTKRPRPMTMWSTASMSRSLPAVAMLRLSRMSSGDGAGSPDG